MFLGFRSVTYNNIVVIYKTMTYIALKVARFSSKKSMVKNLNKTTKRIRILKYRSKKLKRSP